MTENNSRFSKTGIVPTLAFQYAKIRESAKIEGHMKIALFTDTYLPQINGVATTVDELARGLREKGHEVYIIAPREPKYKDASKYVLRLPSVQVSKQPELRLATPFPEKTLMKILSIDFDIIHGFSGGIVVALGLTIARLRKIPFVCTYNTRVNHYAHYLFNGKVITPEMLEKGTSMFANQCSQLIAPTEKIKNELLSFGVTKPITIIPNGVNIKLFAKTKKGFLREKLSLPKDATILLSVGRFGKEKSLDFLIHAAKFVIDAKPHVYLVLVGDGPERTKLTKLAQKLGIAANVLFTGFIEPHEMPNIYADATLFVFASQTETQGMVVFESLAAGVPVIAVEDSVFEGVVVNGKNGFLLPKDSEIFAKKIIGLLKDKQSIKTLSKIAKERIQDFSSEVCAAKFTAFYTAILPKKKRKYLSPRRIITLLKKKITWSDVKKITSSYLLFQKDRTFPISKNS